MREITTHLPVPACYLLFFQTGIAQFQRLDPDPFPPARTRARGLGKDCAQAGAMTAKQKLSLRGAERRSNLDR
jgi:hypothetical protein